MIQRVYICNLWLAVPSWYWKLDRGQDLVCCFSRIQKHLRPFRKEWLACVRVKLGLFMCGSQDLQEITTNHEIVPTMLVCRDTCCIPVFLVLFPCLSLNQIPTFFLRWKPFDCWLNSVEFLGSFPTSFQGAFCSSECGDLGWLVLQVHLEFGDEPGDVEEEPEERDMCVVKLRFGGFLPPYTSHVRPISGENGGTFVKLQYELNWFNK